MDNTSFTVPSLAEGTYYIGYIADTGNAETELNEGNNASLPQNTLEFQIVNSTALPEGAVKVLNSWGDSGSWENVNDGHYWITYDTMQVLQMGIYYYLNSFDHIYEPTIVAVFEIDHQYRDDCQVILSLGDPNDPVTERRFQVEDYNGNLSSGPQPFPNNALAFDISEFAPYINEYDVYLSVNNSGSYSGTLQSFSIEYYSVYDSGPFHTVVGQNGSFSAASKTDYVANTAGELSDDQWFDIQPASRAIDPETGLEIIQSRPSAQELERDMELIGVYEEGRNYNQVVNGNGTGLRPPTEEQWQQMYRLRSVDTGLHRGTSDGDGTQNFVDLTQTQWFPPVGSQGDKGSCVAFNTAYYVHTYLTAREYGWDLSSMSWDGGDSGIPSNPAFVFSPDYVYHQINSGADNGSFYFDAVSLLVNQGAATWESMPYDMSDHTTWPSEAAFREAARYRGREASANEVVGYFTIETDEDIRMLHALLQAGYPVVTGVNTDYVYEQLDANDVLEMSSKPDGYNPTNHANTIVGFSQGTSWDPSNPD